MAYRVSQVMLFLWLMDALLKTTNDISFYSLNFLGLVEMHIKTIRSNMCSSHSTPQRNTLLNALKSSLLTFTARSSLQQKHPQPK